MGERELANRNERNADEGLFEALVRNASGVIAVLDAEGSPRFINQTAEKFLGYPPRQLTSRGVDELMQLVHPADLPAARETFNEVLKKPGELVLTELQVQHAAGKWLWMEAAFQNLLEEESVRGIVVNVRNISERKRAEAALRESEERFRALVQEASDLIAVLAPDGEVRYLSPAVKSVLGREPEERLGKNAFEHLHPDDAERVFRTFARLLEHPGSTTIAVGFRMRHKDGSWRYLEATATNLIDNPSVRGIVVNASDVTERRTFEEQLRHQALHDPLTGLPNRTLFMDRLGHALARTQGRDKLVAVLFLDLDNFKLVNDSLGHEAGDRLLVGVAERLRAGSRSGDIVARFGGDEFAVLLQDIADEGDATRAALRIAEELRPPFVLGVHEVFATPSIGIALSASTGNQAEDLLRSADRAMYQAKNSGEVYYVATKVGTTGQALRRLELEGDLRRAIEREQLKIYYQPTVLLEDGRIVGMEALVRWDHPERGLLPSPEFIPVAEETGLIIPIGRWVLETACRQARVWWERHPSTPDLRVWVNLSAKQFQQPKLVDEVARVLEVSGLRPACLGLEITESIAMGDTRTTTKTLRELADLGVRLAIDDFGTGHSSLSALHRFPVEVLKIDRSFIRGLGDDSGDTVILSAMIDLARTLGMRAVAEGVESEEQLARLRELGCEIGQGDYFSEPLPGAAVSRLWQAQPK